MSAKSEFSPMENKDEILKKLWSGEAAIQEEALATVKAEGDIGLAPALLDLLLQVEDHHVRAILSEILADIKDSSFRPLLIERIRQTQAETPKSLLVRICWESALDFSDDAELFAHLVLEEGFAVALEAATVLENMQHLLPAVRTRLSTLLKQGNGKKEKQFLIGNILEAFEEQTAREEEDTQEETL